jgi:hypothetical protein
MATAPKRVADWLGRFTRYLDVVMVVSDPVTAGRGSDELRQVAREVVRVTDDWAGMGLATRKPFDIHHPTFAHLLQELAQRADLEWPRPAGYADWAAVFDELLRQADMAHT